MIDPSEYGASWYAANVTVAPSRPRLTAELDVDVCVIGAGLAGLSVAREVARRGWSVAVLEAHRIAWNASGRNTGFVMPGFNTDAQSIVERVGLDHARSLWALSETGAEYVRDTIRETGMPGAELSEHGWLHVSKRDDARERENQAALLAGSFGAAVEFWPRERVRATLLSDHYFSAVYYRNAFSIHPLNYALGLAAAAEAAGARIFENTPAIAIDPAGVRKRVSTPSARIRAAHVVLAGNAHLGALMPKLAGTLVPISTYVLVTEPMAPRLGETIRTRAAVSDTDLADNHYRIVGGDRLMWAGGSTVWVGNPRRHVRGLIGDLARTYPRLADARAEYVWTGMLGNTVHRMPQIGEVAPGLWLASGFGGHGINTTAMAGDVIARGIVEDAQTWRLFAPFERVWAGGLVGRAVGQVWYYGYRASERIAAARARRHEAERRKSGELPLIPEEALAPPVVPEEPQAAEPMLEAVAAPKPRRKRKRTTRKKAPTPVPAEAAAPLDDSES